ncbi:bifunctional 2-polyprenyl-6-hydroxyphenol methylase/3-demethylubiquinol 3-O-methyltransferase UbiG [Candidatus Odyssella acanthamoebae]|uniref:Ubiquinone biosynthesis O-methyltransferase n=1 Tax=Candidatus Odyssella acanthamoebae TaxID=91604 RepID=A0A077AX48_9PROT|nr:bifunctional 2-polyprenyl-6-hydroxyphenol methylase/3-demethylubiquinol 3-O-methyltransferase UbiG [Candidatus Paracaedibacter acanthamoebae]AIK96193.1 3-demethylubiquinone-9 3-methyltransferase [Candidatus Paracaedibacter acanthamoebae]
MSDFKINTLDPAEIARFSKISSQWWDENGPFKPLHHLNPTRLDYITKQLSQHYFKNTDKSLNFQGLSILDIGCGGGLITEPLTRLGATVTGIDASEKTIEIAKAHAALMNLGIQYTCTTAEDLATTQQQYDAVLALEIIEHVADVSGFIKTCQQLVKPGGLVIFSTINRTLKSYAIAIVGAEYVMRWLPVGTHDWKKFLTPSELGTRIRESSLTIQDITGMSFNPLNWSWRLSRDLDVNYFITSVKK